MSIYVDNITILKDEQIFGDNSCELFDKVGRTSPITDFSIMLGAYASGHRACYDEAEGKTGYWWTSSPRYNGVEVITAKGEKWDNDTTKRDNTIKPVIPFTRIEEVLKLYTKFDGTVRVIEYGEYPQYAVNLELKEVLDKEYENNNLKETGKIYTVDNGKESRFTPKEIIEYIYEEEKYVRVQCIENIRYELTNGQINLPSGSWTWIRVSPISWYVDEKNNLLISKRGLIAGIQFDSHRRGYDGDFKSTNLYNYLNTYFKKEIIPSYIYKLTPEEKAIQQKGKRKLESGRNPFKMNLEKISEEDIIREAIDCEVPVFLHGRSSEGKSARVKQIDPNCEILYLRNTTPEGLNGKSIYDQSTGKIIDVKPTWLEKLEEKCQKEPNKNHILFFDEITNALPSIQGMAFNIVLDKEVNGKWKLPENARIVAAGNDVQDSLAANKLAEPLFNRFCHVYIETTVDKWLKWAAKNNIHPAIYSFVAYKGDSVLRSAFNGETPNADPRKWEMASKILYKSNNPTFLRGLIGEEITKDFTEFCNAKVITLNEFLNNDYKDLNLEEFTDQEKYATVMGLSRVDEKNVEEVRNFIKRLGQDFISLFDILWSSGVEERLEILAELNIKEKQK